MAIQSQLFNSFAGGLDLKSSPPNVQPGFTPNAMNFKIREDGGIEKILGYKAFATSPVDLYAIIGFSQPDGTAPQLLAFGENDWYSFDAAGTPTLIESVANSSQYHTFSYFRNEEYDTNSLWIMDGENSLRSWDGTTMRVHAPGVNSGPPVGRLLGIWNGKMYVAPADKPTRVVWSDLNNFTDTNAWPAENFVDLTFNTSGEEITGGIVSNGILVVFTKETIVEFFGDSGENRLVDDEVGCVNAATLKEIGGGVFGLSRKGPFRYDTERGDAGRGTTLLTQVDPLFIDRRPRVEQSCAVVFDNRYLVSFLRSPSKGYLTLDVYPRLDGAVMANDYPAAYWANSRVDTFEERQYFIDYNNRKRIRLAFEGGAFLDENDAPTDIACYYETAPFSFGTEMQLKRLYRLRVTGWGEGLGVATALNYAQDFHGDKGFGIIDPGITLWNQFNWNEANWAYYSVNEGNIRLKCRAREFSFKFYESSQDEKIGKAALGQSTDRQGGVAIYAIEPHFVVTGRTR